MKKLCLCFALLLLCLTACTAQKPEETPSEPVEPPLTEFSASVAVPDFLTDEQQLLYRRAHCLYQHMFGGETAAIDSFAPDNADAVESGPSELVEKDGYIYQLAVGRYRNWSDFDAVVHSVFTDTFWDSRNSCLGEDGTVPIYRDADGRLAIVELSRGAGYWWDEDAPDQFRLEERTEDAISFTLIGHYQKEDGEAYTLEFPMKLVLTDDGWRFEEFHTSLADEE